MSPCLICLCICGGTEVGQIDDGEENTQGLSSYGKNMNGSEKERKENKGEEFSG